MAVITHRWPLTTDATEVVAGLATANVGGVTFSSAGALFTGVNAKALTFTKTLSSSYSFSFWAKSGGTQPAKWSPFMSAVPGSQAGTGFFCDNGILYAVSYWAGGKLEVTSKVSKFLDGSEHLHVLTYNGATIQYKIDGDTTLSGESSTIPVNFDFAIGRMGMYTNENISWNGTVRDVRIYDGQVLTEADMAAIYAAGPIGAAIAKPQAMTGGM